MKNELSVLLKFKKKYGKIYENTRTYFLVLLNLCFNKPNQSAQTNIWTMEYFKMIKLRNRWVKSCNLVNLKIKIKSHENRDFENESQHYHH